MINVNSSNNQLLKKTNYDFVDLMKFIGSVLIFIMHCWDKYADSNIYVSFIARWGVPFFFIASSFFLFSKEDDGNISKDILKKYVKRIASLYMIWFVYNIPNVIYRQRNFDYTSFESWTRMILGFLLSSTFLGSWYLLSSIISAVVVYNLSKRLNTKIVLILTFFVQLICVLSSSYYRVLPEFIRIVLAKYMFFPLNMLGGVFYFAIGKWIFENKALLLKIRLKVLTPLFIVSYVGYMLEILGCAYLGLLRTTDQSFLLFISSAVLFVISIKVNIKINHAGLFRKLSTIIYCSQGNVIVFSILLSQKLETDSLVFKYIIGFVILSIVVIIVLMLQKNDKIKFAKYLT